MANIPGQREGMPRKRMLQLTPFTLRPRFCKYLLKGIDSKANHLSCQDATDRTRQPVIELGRTANDCDFGLGTCWRPQWFKYALTSIVHFLTRKTGLPAIQNWLSRA